MRSARAAPRVRSKCRMPAALATRSKVPSDATQEELAGVLHGVVGHGLDVALGHVQVQEAVVVDVVELGVPGRGGQTLAARGGLGRADAAVQRDVAEVRALRPVGQRHELVVGHAREVVLGIAVTGDVVAGDAHALELHALPALLARPGGGRLAWFDAPELLLALLGWVVLAVVGDAQVAPARAVPVAEEQRERAVAGHELLRRLRSRRRRRLAGGRTRRRSRAPPGTRRWSGSRPRPAWAGRPRGPTWR